MRADPVRSTVSLRLSAALVTASLGWAMAGDALAQDQDRREQSVKVGEADLYPVVRIDYFSNDNVRVTPDDTIDGTAVVLSPSFELVADRRLLRLSLGYFGSYSAGSESERDYTDHRLRADANAQFDKRRRAGGYVEYIHGHQDFGFGLTRRADGTIDEPVVFDDLAIGGNFRYGVPDARGNIEVGLRVLGRSYANFEERTDGRDYTSIAPYALFSYRLSGDTRALIEGRYTSVSVDDGVDDRDQLSLFGGLEFSATGQLRGSARIGVTDASYSSGARSDTSLLAIEGRIDYRPVDFATFRLFVDRQLDDTIARADGEGSQAITDRVRLTWEHVWSARLSHVAYAERSSTSRDCPDIDTVTPGAGYELNYAVRRWLEFGARVDIDGRDGSGCEGGDDGSALEFDRRIVGVHVRASL